MIVECGIVGNAFGSNRASFIAHPYWISIGCYGHMSGRTRLEKGLAPTRHQYATYSLALPYTGEEITSDMCMNVFLKFHNIQRTFGKLGLISWIHHDARMSRMFVLDDSQQVGRIFISIDVGG